MIKYLYHYGVKGMKWGVRKDSGSLTSLGKRKTGTYFDEDGNLTEVGKAHVISIDGADENLGRNMHDAQRYVKDYVDRYGEAPVNRMRFFSDVGMDISNRSDHASYDYEWNNTTMQDIYDAYDDYKRSNEWD